MVHVGRAAEPRPLGRRAREPALRRDRRGARLPRRLRLARRERPAPAAPAGARSTAPSRSSCSPRRRSRTRASSAPRCSARRSTVVGDDAAPRAERTIVLWNPPLLDEELGLRASALAEAAKLQAALRRARPAHADVREEPQGGGARSTASPPSGSATTRGSRRTAPATRPRSGARSSGASPTASCSASPRRTRSSSASTSACSTRSSRSAFPARSPRCASSGAARAGATAALAVLVATEDALDQYFMREPDDAARPAGRGGDPRPREPACARRPRARRGVRGAARPTPTPSCSARGDRGRARDPELQQTPRRHRLGGTRPPGGAHLAPLGRARRVHASSTRRPARCSASSSASRAYSTVHEGAVYLHLGESYLVRELDLTALHAVVEPFTGNWYTQAKKETIDRDRRAAARRAAARARARVRRDRGDRAGRRLRAQDDPRRRSGSSSSRSTCPPTTLRDRGDLVPARAAPARRSSTRCRSCSARCTPPSTR